MRHGEGSREPGIAAVGGLDDPVRRRLYGYVAGCRRAVGRDEAAGAVGIGRPLAAYHLDKLVDLGLLTASYQRSAGRRGPGAGRPAKLYARSAREFSVTIPPREYELAARLLAQAVAADISGAARAELGPAAHQLGLDLGRSSRVAVTPDGDGEPVAGRRQRGAEIALAQHGFEPVRAADGTISLANCPFHKLVAHYPDVVCGMNLALIGGLIDGLGLAGLRPEVEPQAGRCCVVIRADQD
jgi:predicted ArsR family transcriptional regulator